MVGPMSSQEQSVAVAAPPREEVRREHRRQVKDGERKPKLLPPYAVVVLNDDEHTFDYVVNTFRKVFGYTESKCYLLALMIHTVGRAAVWTGPKEVAELKRDQIRGSGPDFHAAETVRWPLGVMIEPMPGH
jgi:ATP-dependent Clp protease adaptor protein ClpS